MNQREFQIIQQYIGLDLLRYITNRPDIQKNNQLEELGLDKAQLAVLNDLSQKIKQIRIQYIHQGGIGDGIEFGLNSLVAGNDSLFNQYRKSCGGDEFLSSWEEDPVMQFLFLVARRNYPKLLINNQSSFRSINFGPQLDVPDYESFIQIIKKDDLDKLANDEDGFNYMFKFTTKCGLKSVKQVSTACSTVITRSFMNCCNEMSYDFDSLMSEIERNITLLRNLANGEEVEFKSYVGIRGLSFSDFEILDLQVAELRQLSSLSNPSIQTNRIATSHNSNGESYLSGCILKVIHKMQIDKLESDANYGFTKDHADYQDAILRALKFSLILTLQEVYGISPCFYESGFPLVSPGNNSFNDNRPNKYFILKNEQIQNITEWFNLLMAVDFSHINITVKRLGYAIFGRKTPEDSIMDAIIAWEGMFSEAFETTFKVTGTIAKFLKETPEEREAFLPRLKKLYNLRSEIVHGKKSKLLEKEDIYDLREEVISIGIECLSKLLKNKELLKLTPPLRIKEILIMK